MNSIPTKSTRKTSHFLFLIGMFALFSVQAQPQLQPMQPKNGVKLSAGDGREILALYQNCKNELMISIKDFKDYKELTYEITGGTFIPNPTDLKRFWIVPAHPHPVLTISHNQQELAQFEFPVRRIPLPVIQLEVQDQVVVSMSGITRKNLKKSIITLTGNQHPFFHECPEDARWTATYKVELFSGKQLIFTQSQEGNTLKKIKGKYLKKSDSVTITAENCSHVNFENKSSKVPQPIKKSIFLLVEK